ncbi:glycosyltransferase family 2 protein [Pontibaca salina]|uniref:Glycosyltransferase family 2 protein n=1 Tax=Pontibaca salina TaxID=2795731 RepID=A0A934HLA8_9RHOB|nr:glycosyltransferase family 2 protein [Pontibaca salina]MBI6630198.1 glycosyltransferase family 2 protein [Pontibaca salina]
MTENPTLLVVILNYRTPELTLKAAGAALADSDQLRAEIVIVDNDSRDGSFDQISKVIARKGWSRNDRVRLIDAGRNGGFGAGNNVGIQAGLADGTRPDFVYLLNSDAWPEQGAISCLLDFMHATPKAGLAGSGIRGDDGVDHQTAFRFPSIASEFEGAVRTGIFSRLLARHIVALPCFDEPTQVDWVAGASLMIRMSMLEQIDLFDETFFLYFEETELCHRAARAGWECWYVPDSQVVHIGSVSTGMKTWRRTPPYWFDSRQHYFTKSHGHVYWAAATLAHIAGGTIWRLRRLLSRAPLGEPPRFMRDLIAHGTKNLIRRTPSVGSLAPRILEDKQ